MLAQLNTYDLLFVLSAVAFNLLIAVIFIAEKLGNGKLVRTFGTLWLCLLFLYWDKITKRDKKA